MKIVELFAGCGGAHRGLVAAGLEIAECVEWDHDSCDSLRDHGAPVTEIDVREWVPGGIIDVLWASPPCQGWSTAGKRLGAQDPRNGWPWTLDAIDRADPRWFVGENVRGMLFHAKKSACNKGKNPNPEHCPGCYTEHVVMAGLRERFAYAEYRVLDAADFGVPQHRRRVIFVAGPRAIEWPKATHGPGLEPYATMRKALDLKDRDVAIGSGGNRSVGRTYRELTDEPSTTTAAQHGGGAGNCAPKVVDLGPWSIDRPSPTVCVVDVKGAGIRANQIYRGAPLSHGPGRASDALLVATGRRRLTIEECAILQDFDEDPTLLTQTKKSRYRQIGNAVPPKMAEVVARAIIEADE